MPNNRIDELIRRFNKINGGNNYSQGDLLKYLISRIDDIDDKMGKVNVKLDNHVNELSNRITVIETCISNIKWFFIAILIPIVALVIDKWIS